MWFCGKSVIPPMLLSFLSNFFPYLFYTPVAVQVCKTSLRFVTSVLLLSHRQRVFQLVTKWYFDRCRKDLYVVFLNFCIQTCFPLVHSNIFLINIMGSHLCWVYGKSSTNFFVYDIRVCYFILQYLSYFMRMCDDIPISALYKTFHFL